jgi:PAS domain S-box-containing protein
VTLRILLVEDSADDAELALRSLREAGIEPQWERVATEAALRAALAGAEWDATLVDYNLPGFGGPQALRLLAETAPDLPAITVSGAISEETAVATITAGAVDYVLKDNLTRLAPAVERAVEGAELRRRQRQTAEQARQSQFAVDHASQAIVYVSEGGALLYGNQAALRLGAIPPEELVGQDIWAWIPSLDKPRWGEVWRIAAQGPIVDFETSMTLPDGEERYVSATLELLQREEGSFMIVYARDISKRVRAEEALAQKAGLLARAEAVSHMGSWRLDLATGAVTWSDEMYEIFGIEPAAFGHDVSEAVALAVHPDDRARLNEANAAVMRDGIPRPMDYRIKRPDGAVRWVHAQGEQDRDASGRVIALAGFVLDVTERKLAEDALRTSEERYRSLFEESPVAMWEDDDSAVKVYLEELVAAGVDDVGAYLVAHPQEYARCIELCRTLDANQAAVRLFEAKSREELLARNSDLYRLGSSRGTHLFWAAMLAGERSATFEETNLSLTGKRLDVLETCTVVPGHEQTFDRIYIADVDITERKRAEGALRESQQLFTEFAEHLPGELWIRDHDQRYLYVNAQLAAAEGRRAEEMLGAAPADIWAAEEAAKARALIERALAGDVVDDVSTWPFGEDERVYRSMLFPIVRDGGPPMVGGLAFDVTDEQHAQEAVRRQAEQLRRTVEGSVLAMSHMVETRDPYTAGHERRAADLVVAIAKELGMSGIEFDGLRLAALIHDIGKIAVPAEILSKPGRLSTVEFSLVKQHSRSGYDILEAIEFDRPVAQMVLEHHERLDGSGYPQGLSGEDILPEAGILAVADVVEAMSSHRPYRAALGIEPALAEIRENAGVKYDAAVAAACLRVFEGGFSFID